MTFVLLIPSARTETYRCSFIPIVHFKRLGSRHIHKEIEISQCVFGFNEKICETGLKPNSDT